MRQSEGGGQGRVAVGSGLSHSGDPAWSLDTGQPGPSMYHLPHPLEPSPHSRGLARVQKGKGQEGACTGAPGPASFTSAHSASPELLVCMKQYSCGGC